MSLATTRADILRRLKIVQDDITIAYVNRELFTTLRTEIVTRAPESDGTWLNSYQTMFAHSQVMAIRRLADRHRDRPDSLWWVIQRIRNTPRAASRAALVEHWSAQRGGDADDMLLRRLLSGFDRLAGPEDVPSSAHLDAMQSRLADSAAAVVAYADQNIAHRDPRGRRQTLTFDELDVALANVAAIANEVSVITTGAHTMYEHVAIPPGWRASFRGGLFPLPGIAQPPRPDEPERGGG